ncbi:MAG TPA: hypothetical protein VNZ52_07245 [Candidatus Thermoplasmatota archaeon]|nr:hypothetical protein [Candidatus Thermoplasmatota archaeon]
MGEPKPEAPRRGPRDVVIVGMFTLLASLVNAFVPLLLDDSGTAEAAASPSVLTPGPLALQLRAPSGAAWSGSPVVGRLLQGGEVLAEEWSDAGGRCVWATVPPGGYQVEVAKPPDRASLATEWWGRLDLQAPYGGDFVRRVPVMRTLDPGPVPRPRLAAEVSIVNPAEEPREVWLRCVWDADRTPPFDVVVDVAPVTLPPRTAAPFTCAAPDGLPAGPAFELGYEVHAAYGEDRVTDSWWTGHRYSPTGPPQSPLTPRP